MSCTVGAGRPGREKDFTITVSCGVWLGCSSGVAFSPGALTSAALSFAKGAESSWIP